MTVSQHENLLELAQSASRTPSDSGLRRFYRELHSLMNEGMDFDTAVTKASDNLKAQTLAQTRTTREATINAPLGSASFLMVEDVPGINAPFLSTAAMLSRNVGTVDYHRYQ